MSEYTPIPLLVGPKTVHTIFVRKHFGRRNNEDDSDSDEDSTSAVFVANLPLDTTEDNIRDICQALGNVVLDHYTYQGNRHGLIHLLDEDAAGTFLSKAKKVAKKGKVAWQQYGPRGVEGYLARHYSKFPSEADLQEKVDDYMELFAEQEEREAEEVERAAQAVDEDGFRLVVYNKRKRLSDIPPPTTEIAPRKKKKTLEKTDFYRFQLRAQRKQEMSDLLTRYQQDKEKVEELKQRKRFRPY